MQLYKRLAAVFCMLVIFAFSPVAAHADTSRLLIVKSESSNFYNTFATKLSTALEAYCPQNCSNQKLEITIITAEQLKEGIPLSDNYQFAITLGVKAKNLLMANATSVYSKTVLHAMVPKHLAHHDSNFNHYSLVLDQPYERVITIHQQLINRKKPVGIIYTNDSQRDVDQITQAASQLGFNIKTYKIDLENQSLGESLTEILDEVGSVIMIPDKSLYNRSTINEILLTGYLKQIPFTGYSKALAKTGTLASIVTPLDSIITDITNLVAKFQDGKAVEPVNYPSTYQLILNEQIYKSLEIDIDPEILTADRVEVIK